MGSLRRHSNVGLSLEPGDHGIDHRSLASAVKRKVQIPAQNEDKPNHTTQLDTLLTDQTFYRPGVFLTRPPRQSGIKCYTTYVYEEIGDLR